MSMHYWKVSLVCHSPVFVGSGEKFMKSQYIYDKNEREVLFLDETGWIRFLTKHGIFDDFSSSLLSNPVHFNLFSYISRQSELRHKYGSVRNILYLERNGKGYNVSLQVLDAILCHNGEMLSKKYEPDRKKTKEQFLQEYHDCWHKENASLELKPMTLEGCVVRISDVISYIGKDIEDAMSVGILQKKDLPENVVKVLGDNNKSIMNKLIGDLMIHSYQKPYLRFSHEVFEALSSLLFFLGEKVHHHPVLEKENAKLSRMVKELFDVYLEELENNDQDSNIVKFKNKMVENYQKTPNPLIVSDYLSMMTDTYVLNDYERKFLPILHGEKL